MFIDGGGKALKIAITSLADINNYGDVFFPLIMKTELENRLPDVQVDIFTNIHFKCNYYETMVYKQEIMKQYDAVIMGGGELISPYDDEAFRTTYGVDYDGKPSDIAYGWLDLPKIFKAWFAVGAHPVLFDYPTEVDLALQNLNYLSVRGVISKKVLERGFINHNNDIRVMPDLGWLFPKYIDNNCENNIQNFYGLGKNQKYCVVQAIQDLNIEEDMEMIAQALVNFSRRRNVKIILLPIMQTEKQWMERNVLEKIYARAKMYGDEVKLLPFGMNIMQIGMVLKHAEFFVGSSLHGAVTALAYGKPAVNIRSGINTKLQDIHAVRCRSTCFANGWDVLPGVLERLCNEAENKIDHKYAAMYAEYMRYRIEKEFDSLAAKILQ